MEIDDSIEFFPHNILVLEKNEVIRNLNKTAIIIGEVIKSQGLSR